MRFALSNTKLNLILLASIVVLSILSIFWHHQTYLLYKKIKRENIANHQIVALNKQLLSQYSQAISGEEIKSSAIKNLGMRKINTKDMGRWFKGIISL
jgi:cell division protein FtsL